MEALKYKKSLILILCFAILGGAFYYISQKPAFTMVKLVHEVYTEDKPEDYIALEAFNKTLSDEIWRNIQDGSKLLSKFNRVGESFRSYLNRMIHSYVKSILENTSRLVRINEMAIWKYLAIQARLSYLVLSHPTDYKTKDLAHFSVVEEKLFGHLLSFDLLFKKEKSGWQIYAIENLEL